MKAAELVSSRELMVNLTLRELRGKYKRSVLGWTWSLLNPLASMLIFTIVFSFFLKVKPPTGDPSGLHNFAFFLLCGMLPWNFLNNGMMGGMSALIGNANLIKKVYFPREVLVSATVAAFDVSFLIEMGVLAAALLVAGVFVFPWIPVALLLVALLTVFVLGIALTVSVLNVYFRDVQHLISIVLMLWFYATPIVYPITYVPQNPVLLGHRVPLRHLYTFNPMVRFAETFRDALYHLRTPSWNDMLFLVVVSALSLALGMWVFSKLEGRLAEEL
ncbi:MAG: ABC transporter permease [Acidimicrobiia bacterium]|nr:ABC transporter permease [Acidimicrobiia bacterium]